MPAPFTNLAAEYLSTGVRVRSETRTVGNAPTVPEPLSFLERFAAMQPAWANDPSRHCAGQSKERFFGDDSAKQICHSGPHGAHGPCPFIAQCLRYALDNHIEHGVWGGTSQRERRRLAKEARQRRNGNAYHYFD